MPPRARIRRTLQETFTVHQVISSVMSGCYGTNIYKGDSDESASLGSYGYGFHPAGMPLLGDGARIRVTVEILSPGKPLRRNPYHRNRACDCVPAAPKKAPKKKARRT